MGLDILYGKIILHIEDNSKIITFMEVEFISGAMNVNSMVNGQIIKCTVKEHSLGKMEENMLEGMSMTRKKEMEYSFGLTVVNTMDNGKMVNNMAKEIIFY